MIQPGRIVRWVAATAVLAAGAEGCGGKGMGTPATGASAGMGGVAGATSGGAGSTGRAGSSRDAGRELGTAGDAGSPGVPVAGELGTAGGTISDAAGAITLRIPAGALLGDTTFYISSGPPLPASPNYTAIPDETFQVQWTGAGFAAGATVGIDVPLSDSQAYSPSVDGTLQADPPPISCGTVLILDCPAGREYTLPVAPCYANGVPYCCPTNDYTKPDVPVGCDFSGGGPDGGRGSGGSGAGGPSTACAFNCFSLGIANASATARPVITAQPAPTVTCEIGQSAGFAVNATGAPTLKYQWLRNGSVIDGQTTSRFDPYIDGSDDGAQYTAVVSNDYGFAETTVKLSVLPPAPLQWATPIPVGPSGGAFRAGVDAPAVASVGGYPVVVWNDGGTLRGAPGSGSNNPFTPVESLALPMSGRPRLLGVDVAAVGYVVFIDDDGTGGCAAGSGNRLSAVALGAGDDGPFPLSDRVTLYPPSSSTGHCIAGFAAGLADSGTETSPLEVVFALVELGGTEIKSGTAFATFQAMSPPGQSPAGSWAWMLAGLSAPVLDPGCDGPPLLGPEGLATPVQAFARTSSINTGAILAWESAGNVCSARLAPGASGWFNGAAVVMDRAAGVAPVAAIDSFANALVVANQVHDPAAATRSYDVTAAFEGAAWSLQVLDGLAAPATIAAAFDRRRNAYVAWASSLPTGGNVIRAAVRTADVATTSGGTWGATELLSAGTAADAREPCLCAEGAAADGVSALYRQSTGASGSYQVVGNRWLGGRWSTPGAVQTSGNDGGEPACGALPNEAVWREADPAVPGAFRIVETSAPESAISTCDGAMRDPAPVCAQGIAAVVDFPAPDGVGDVITAGPDGNVWFTNWSPAFVARMDAQGTIAEFTVDAIEPITIAAGPDGNLWLLGLENASGVVPLRAITPTGANVHAFNVANDSGPIAAGPDGNLWLGTGTAAISKMSPSTGAVTTFPLANKPTDIVAGPDGNVWFTDSGNHVVSITPGGTTSVLTPPSTVSLGSWLGGIALGPDGNLWFTERDGMRVNPATHKIGRIKPPNTIDEFPVCEVPLAITAGGDGNLWYTTTATKVGRITPAGAVTEFATHAVATASLAAIAHAGTDRNLWIVQEDGTIGRITAP